MDLLNHDLAHEFPDYLDKIRALKLTDKYFAKLFTQYDEDNYAIAKYEQGVGVITAEALEEMKKQRLKTKDELYQILQTAEMPEAELTTSASEANSG